MKKVISNEEAENLTACLKGLHQKHEQEIQKMQSNLDEVTAEVAELVLNDLSSLPREEALALVQAKIELVKRILSRGVNNTDLPPSFRKTMEDQLELLTKDGS